MTRTPPVGAVDWEGFAGEAPDLAKRAAALFAASGVVLVGTVRRDGSPRISPVEPIVAGGELYLGMMPASLKALDLLRDGRCTIHSAVSDRTGSSGEFKAHGSVAVVTESSEYVRYGEVLAAAIGWEPPDHAYPLFKVRFVSAALFETGDDRRVVTRWRAGRGIDVFEQRA